MSALQKLVRRCNELDITEQINYLGDASMSYEAQKELAALTARVEAAEAEAGKLREALTEILTDSTWDDCKETAHAALQESEK
jgi:hypothetical protein